MNRTYAQGWSDLVRQAIFSLVERIVADFVDDLSNVGLLLVAALPLVLCWYLLHGLRTPGEEVSEVLISQLVQQSPELLGTRSTRPGIGHRASTSGDKEPPF